MEYKGYYSSVHYDPNGPIFYGKLEFIKALVFYEGTTALNIKKAFYEAVDDYLLLCEKKKIEPEKPFNLCAKHCKRRVIEKFFKLDCLFINTESY